MNKGKNGPPFMYPSTFIQFSCLMYTFLHSPYRQLEGYLQALAMKGRRIVHQNGRRWAVESVFSAIKRIFGETVRATSIEGMFNEVRRMLTFCSIILSV
jgi:hypothetical protein